MNNQPEISTNKSFLSQSIKNALKYYKSNGYPDNKDEKWKFINFNPWKDYKYSIDDGNNDLKNINLFELENSIPIICNNNNIIFPKEALDQISILSFDDAQKKNFNFKKYFNKKINYNDQPIEAENTAFFKEGIIIEIKPGQKLDKPIHIFHIISDSKDKKYFPRILFISGEDSSCSVLESCISINSKNVFINAVTELVLEENSNLEWNRIQKYSDQIGQTMSTNAVINESANFIMNNIDLGGSFIRSEFQLYLESANSECKLNGVYVGNNRQKYNIFSKVHHLKPHCRSNQNFKGVLDDNSHAVFRGITHVYSNSKKTDADQSNKNILLSKKAKINSIPQLEIYEDDVKCSHGSTTGYLDEDVIFYMKTRGLSGRESKSLLINGFVNEIVENINNNNIKDLISKDLSNKLSKMVL